MVCDFQFAPGTEWDYAFHIQLLERLRGEYPGKVRRQQLLEAGLHVAEGKPEAQLSMKGTRSRVHYSTADGKRIVAVGENALGVHTLRPYDGWEHFRPRVERALRVFEEVVRPVGVTRLAVRYINKVLLPVDDLRLDDYFTAPPRMPEAINVTLGVFLSRVESSFPDLPITLVSTFAALEPPPRGGCVPSGQRHDPALE